MTPNENLILRVDELEELVALLSICLTSETEEPYLKALVRLRLLGEKRALAMQVIGALLDRARGVTPARPRSLLAQFPQAEVAFLDRPITRTEALAVLGASLGLAPEVAETLLEAHRDRGLYAEGHEALGT